MWPNFVALSQNYDHSYEREVEAQVSGNLANGVTTAKCEPPREECMVSYDNDDVPAQCALKASAIVVDEYCTGTSPFAQSIPCTAEK